MTEGLGSMTRNPDVLACVLCLENSKQSQFIEMSASYSSEALYSTQSSYRPAQYPDMMHHRARVAAAGAIAGLLRKTHPRRVDRMARLKNA